MTAIDPTTITNSSITVTPSGGSAVAGTVTLASDGVTLIFVPRRGISTSINVTVGGFNDVQGNPVTNSPARSRPDHGIRQPIVHLGLDQSGEWSHQRIGDQPGDVTMSNLIDAASVNSTVKFVSTPAAVTNVTGNLSVSGATITFTPLTQYPGSTSMEIAVNGLMDVAGNSPIRGGTFTTANTADTPRRR